MTDVKTFYQRNELSEDILSKLAKSKQEAEGLSTRDIRCPYCGFLIDRVYSDIAGHKEIFCRKCKRKYIINLGYFRRQKQQPYFRITFPDHRRQNR